MFSGRWLLVSVAAQPWKDLARGQGPYPESLSSLYLYFEAYGGTKHTQPPPFLYFRENLALLGEAEWRPGASLAVGSGVPQAGPSFPNPSSVAMVIY